MPALAQSRRKFSLIPSFLGHPDCQDLLLLGLLGGLHREIWSIRDVNFSSNSHFGEVREMKRKRYGEAQIVFALRQSEEGTSVLEICRKMGVTHSGAYRTNWKRTKPRGMPS